MVKVPPNDATELPLPVFAAFNDRFPHVRRLITGQPLFAKHRQEGRKEGDCEAGEENGLDLDYGTGRAGPLWESGNIISEGGVVNLVDKDAKEGNGLIVGIGLELGVDLNDECRGDRGK